MLRHDHLLHVQVYRVRLAEHRSQLAPRRAPPSTFELLRPPLHPSFPQTGLGCTKAPGRGSMLRTREPTSPMLLGRMLGPLTLKSCSWERAYVVPLRARSNSGVSSR